LAIGSGGYFYKLRPLSEDEIAERGKKLVKNQNQNRIDNFTVVGSISGFAFSTLNSINLVKRLKGASLGVIAGVAVHAAMLLTGDPLR